MALFKVIDARTTLLTVKYATSLARMDTNIEEHLKALHVMMDLGAIIS